MREGTCRGKITGGMMKESGEDETILGLMEKRSALVKQLRDLVQWQRDNSSLMSSDAGTLPEMPNTVTVRMDTILKTMDDLDHRMHTLILESAPPAWRSTPEA